ncbi:MAG: adenosylcobinamide-GDP ribazoletransferase [Rhodospirillaceae bacterium]|nr:adenosylcobinamide-GDP ribazoletransferase [Rhodospirillaceae bacterium]
MATDNPAPDVDPTGRPRPWRPWDDALLAVAFLTRLPVPARHDAEPGALARAGWAFPLAGVAVAGAGAAVLLATAGSGLHPLGAALLALAVMAVVTGALHEDGLADFADGLGVAGRDRRLAVMRDSHIGAFGVLALVFATGLKATALASLAAPGTAALVLVAAAALSRAALVPTMIALSPARADGLGKTAGRPPVWAAALALVLGFAALVPLWPALGPGVGTLAAAGLAAGLFACWAMHAAVGGHTGDTLGAQQQTVEIAVYLAAATVEINL